LEFLDLFKWICLALFTMVAVIWLLDMIGLVKIRTPAQRKILNTALGTTLIGGMASFAVSAFFTQPITPGPGPGPGPGPTQTSAPSLPAASTSSSASPSAGEEIIPPAPEPPVPAEPGSADPALSQPVRAFLSANNLARPTIDRQWDQRYPPCARQARSAPLPAPDARRCFRELDQFNTAVLRPYQDAYDGYVPRVAELSFSQPAGEVLDFLRAEAGGFTNGTHEIAALYRTISTELYADYALLRKQAYR
jgi:hypothetical protein